MTIHPLAMTRAFRLAALSAVLASASVGAHALTLSVNGGTATSTSIAIGLGSQNNTTATSSGVNNFSNVQTGRYVANDGSSNFDVYCLDPLTSGSAGDYTITGLANWFDVGNGYDSEFSRSNYTAAKVSGNTGAAAAYNYSKQANLTVLGKLVELYKYAYANTLVSDTLGTAAVKQQAFGFAIWEILGTTPGNYSVSSAGLRTNNATMTAAGSVASKYLSALNTGTQAAWQAISTGAGNLGTAATYTYQVYWTPGTPNGQSFIRVLTSGTDITYMPEPTSVLLVAMAGLAWFGTRQLKGRRQPV